MLSVPYRGQATAACPQEGCCGSKARVTVFYPTAHFLVLKSKNHQAWGCIAQGGQRENPVAIGLVKCNQEYS